METQPAVPSVSSEQPEKLPVVSTSSKKPYFIAGGIVLIVLIICVVIYFATDTSPKTQPVSNLTLPKTTAAPSLTPTATVPIKTEYSNPFEEKSQYANPFSQTDSYTNPFENAQ